MFFSAPNTPFLVPAGLFTLAAAHTLSRATATTAAKGMDRGGYLTPE
ncbi:hypothetical protein [Brevibacillus sp. HD3.3A]|nr:hypothetical protein [Brevibacillus sp. HD3.3A]UED70678.1 hypothetical protein HP435_08605 [Brevibacillus sp. HD3.3A]